MAGKKKQKKKKQKKKMKEEEETDEKDEVRKRSTVDGSITPATGKFAEIV